MTAPRIEDLVTVRACEEWGKYTVDEEAVASVLERAAPSHVAKDLRQQTGAAQLMLAWLAQQSILFTVDGALVSQATRDGDGAPPMPPLPFRRMIIEASGDEVWYITPHQRIEVVWLEELIVGARWQGVVFISDENQVVAGERKFAWFVLPIEIRIAGVELYSTNGGDEPLPGDYKTLSPEHVLWRLCVEMVHFITARGVSLSLLTPTRAQRRRAERGHFAMPERLYWVTIDESVITKASSPSDREYHCRWLVRGHWRQLSATGRTWVHPYIKGPVGAPWRGRPIYRAETA